MCGAKHSRYSKVFCERLVPCSRGMSHTARGPRGFWISWDDEKTKRIDFWGMIQVLTDKVKIRQRLEDEKRRNKPLLRGD